MSEQKKKNELEILGQIILDESILPSGVCIVLEEAYAKSGGEIWVIYKSDPDPFPSNPHAHNKKNGYSVDLGNGKFYKKRECVGALNSKSFLKLRQAISQSYPNITLPEINDN